MQKMTTVVVLCEDHAHPVAQHPWYEATNIIGLCNYVNMRRKQLNRGYKMFYGVHVSLLNNGAHEKAWHFIDRILALGDSVTLYIRESEGVPRAFVRKPDKLFRLLFDGECIELQPGAPLPMAADVVRGAKRDDLRVLGLHHGATYAQVKSTYKKLALQHHPDKHGTNEYHTFVQITMAYKSIINNGG